MTVRVRGLAHGRRERRGGRQRADKRQHGARHGAVVERAHVPAAAALRGPRASDEADPARRVLRWVALGAEIHPRITHGKVPDASQGFRDARVASAPVNLLQDGHRRLVVRPRFLHVAETLGDEI